MNGVSAVRQGLSRMLLAGSIVLALVLIGQSLYGIARFWDVFPFGDMDDVIWRYFVGPAHAFWIFHDNEHLPLAVMPLYWIDLRLFAAQGKFLIVCIAVLAVCIGLAPLPALRRALPGQPLLVGSLACCAVAAQLWLGGWGNLLWTKQVHMYMSLFGVVMAIGTAARLRPARWHVVAGACAWAVLAMFSFGYGIIAFPVLFILAAWRRWPARWLACIVLTAVFCLVVYVGLSPPAMLQHGRLGLAFGSTAMQLHYALTFVASPAFNALQTCMPDQTAFLISYVLVALCLMWFGVRIWHGRHEPPSEILAWAVGLALFTMLAAEQTALARWFFGFAHAADSRYIVGQMPFWLGVLLLSVESASIRPARSPLFATAIALGAMAGLLASQQVFLPAMRAHNYQRWNSAMAAIDHVDDRRADLADKLFGVDRVPIVVAGLRTRRWSAFAWRQAGWIGRDVSSFGETRTGCLGAFDTLEPVQGGEGFRAVGWSADSADSARSPWVLLTDKAGIVRGVGHSGGLRWDVTASLHASDELYAGWTGYVPAGVDHAGLSAWLLMGGKHPCRLGPLPAAVK